MMQDRTHTFLRMIRRSQRGRLKVYLGYCAGVGKTYQMLLEGHRLKEEGIDVVIGLLETHGRADIGRLAEGLEVVPRRRFDYRGIAVEEMDLDAILARKPHVALIDELAHTNLPGSTNPKRYQDVQDILEAGIHVISTLNVQHLESLYDTVERSLHVKVRERIPDTVIAEADQIVNVDLTSEDLRKRLEEGKIYPRDRIAAALEHFFSASNLAKLRELTLRELASQIDLRMREGPEEESSATPYQVMVCLSSRGPNSQMLLRYASRLAGRLNRNWYAVYVQTPSEEVSVMDAGTQSLLSDTLTLAKQLGAMVFTYKGTDIVETILNFAREYRVGHIVIGSPGRVSWWKRLLAQKNIVERIIERARGIIIVVLDTREEAVLPVRVRAPSVPEEDLKPRWTESSVASRSLGGLLSPERIVIWDRPVTKDAVLERLVRTAAGEIRNVPFEELLRRVWDREEQVSTFFNEGIAFPHARIDGLTSTVMALGLTRQGVSDVAVGTPMSAVFLMLSPNLASDEQVQLLAMAARAARSRSLLAAFQESSSPEEAMEAIRIWESASNPG